MLLKETVAHWQAQNPSRMGASLSYFAIFSMAPFFILLVSIVGLIFGSSLVESRLFDQISTVAGGDIALFIHSVVERGAAHQSSTIITGLIGFFVLLYGAIGVFRELSYSMDKLWNTEPERKPRRVKGMRQVLSYAKKHIPLLLLFILLAVLFAVSIMSSVALQVIGEQLSYIYPDAVALLQLVEPIVSFLFVALLFGVIYRVLPKTKLPLGEIAFGASVTAVVFLIGELFIGLYLSRFLDRSAFGAAGSLLSILLWVYFSAQVFFLGASFTFNYSKKYGHLKKRS
jgi:membrane protein